MTYIKVDSWQPSEGIRLEGKALEIVKSDTSMSVLAGPGAGKTELLAQRATYLLTTGLCPPPRRILAIAFKVDAARNLGNRVSERCDSMQAQRFESLTLDAFAKRIVDQFLEALPNHWRPAPDYTIFFPNRDIWAEFRYRYGESYPLVQRLNDSQLLKLVDQPLPEFLLEHASTEELQVQWVWWHHQINVGPSRLTFNMIKSLATFILRNQNVILSALRQTYAYVFLDEFQDVNGFQYELIKAAFLGSNAVLTAVGDTNQAIMGFAGARDDIFEVFDADFNAIGEHLLFNFRSNARIVELINDLVATFDKNHVLTECARKGSPVPMNAIEGWVFDTREAEGKFLASYIACELQRNPDLTPEDFVVLARLRVDDIENRINEEFHKQGLKIRNEARSLGGIAIQDLVKEKAYAFLLASLKLALNVRIGQPFYDCRNTIADVCGADLNSDKGYSDSLKDVRNLTDALKQMINDRNPTDVTGAEVTNLILTYVERSELQRTYREYMGGERLNSIISGFEALFDESRASTLSWTECVENMEGANSVRLMTIHKSKGLEYHTVIFIEFNDDAFWGNEDDINVFFVALSRARERVYFSFSKDSRGSDNIKGFVKKLKTAKIEFMKK